MAVRRPYKLKNSETGQVYTITWDEIANYYSALYSKNPDQAKEIGDPNFESSACERVAMRICKEREKNKKEDYSKMDDDLYEDMKEALKNYGRWTSSNRKGTKKVWWWGVLEITQTPDAQIVKSQYRKLARKYHPDVPGGDVYKFNRLNEAYEAAKKSLNIT